MEYKIIRASSAIELEKIANRYLEEDWKPVGSHKVIVTLMQNRYSGQMHMSAEYDREYTQTIVKG